VLRGQSGGARAVGLAGVAAGVFYAAPAGAFLSRRAGRALGIASSLADQGAIALTFDDGPHPRGTPAVLARLADSSVSATFFLTGEQVARYPALARELCAAGHELAVHGYRHGFLLAAGPRATMADIARSRDELEEVTGVRARYYRPPYGVANAAAILMARRLGLEVVLWSRWGRDWARGATPRSIAQLATRDLRGGDIVLLHDSDHYSTSGSWSATAEAVALIVEAAFDRGLAVRSVGAGNAV
jgi:peptidoglycan/xylan/chitin deacetylase (PgdA/CDA1 family)